MQQRAAGRRQHHGPCELAVWSRPPSLRPRILFASLTNLFFTNRSTNRWRRLCVCYHLFTVAQLVKELLWLTNYTCDSVETAGKTLHVRVLLSTTAAEQNVKKQKKGNLHRRFEETRGTAPKLQSELHNYRGGLRPARLSAG